MACVFTASSVRLTGFLYPCIFGASVLMDVSQKCTFDPTPFETSLFEFGLEREDLSADHGFYLKSLQAVHFRDRLQQCRSKPEDFDALGWAWSHVRPISSKRPTIIQERQVPLRTARGIPCC